MSPILVRFLEFTVLPKLFSKLTDRWFGKDKEETEPATPVYDSYNEQALLSKSPRKGSLRIPEGLEPSIDVTSYDKHGDIAFTTETLSGGKVPEKHGFNVITSDGTHTDDHLGGYHWQDSRWNKHYGENLKQFMVVLFHDKKGIIEYSKVYDA